MLERNETEPKSASQIWNQKDKDENASPVLEPIIQVYARQNGQGDEYTVGNLRKTFTLEPGQYIKRGVTDLHQGCNESGEPKSFDNDGPKVGDTTIGNVTCFVSGHALRWDPRFNLQTTPRMKNM
jgi:hypothetical protein